MKQSWWLLWGLVLGCGAADDKKADTGWGPLALAKFKVFASHRFASRNLRGAPPGPTFDLLSDAGDPDKTYPLPPNEGHRRAFDGEGRADPAWHNLGLNSRQMDPYRTHDVWSNYMGFRDVPEPQGYKVYAKNDKGEVEEHEDLVRRHSFEAFKTHQNARAFAHTPMHEQCWNKTFEPTIGLSQREKGLLRWPASMYLPDYHVVSLMHPWNEAFSVPCYSCTAPSSNPNGDTTVFWMFKPEHRLTGPFTNPGEWRAGLDEDADDEDPAIPENDLITRVARHNFRWAAEAHVRMRGTTTDAKGDTHKSGTREEYPTRSGGGRAFYFAQRMRQQPVGAVPCCGFHFEEPDGRLVVDPNPGGGVLRDWVDALDARRRNEETLLDWNALSLLCTRTVRDATERLGNTIINVDSLARPEWLADYDAWLLDNTQPYPLNTFWSIQQHEEAAKSAACDDAEGPLRKFNLRLTTTWEPWSCCSACCCSAGRPHWECDKGPGRCSRLPSYRRRRGFCSLVKADIWRPLNLKAEPGLLNLPTTVIRVPPGKNKEFDPKKAGGYASEECDAWCQWRALDAWLSTPPYRSKGIPWFSTLLQGPKLASVITYFRKSMTAIRDLEEGRGLGLYVERKSCGGHSQKKNCTLWRHCRERQRTGLNPVYPLNKKSAYQAAEEATEAAFEEELADYVYELEDELEIEEDPMSFVDKSDPVAVAAAATKAEELAEDVSAFRVYNWTAESRSLELSVEPGAALRVHFSCVDDATLRDLSRVSWAHHLSKIPVGGHDFKAGKKTPRRIFAEFRRAGKARVDGMFLRITEVQARDTSAPFMVSAELRRAGSGRLETIGDCSLSLTLKQETSNLKQLLVVLGVCGASVFVLLLSGVAGRKILGGKKKKKGKGKKGKEAGEEEEKFANGQRLIRVRRNRNWRQLAWAAEGKEGDSHVSTGN